MATKAKVSATPVVETTSIDSTEEVVVIKKVSPVAFDPNTQVKPVCFKNWIDGNKLCITCRYHKECKKC